MERLVLELLNALDALDATLRDVRTEFLAIDSPPFWRVKSTIQKVKRRNPVLIRYQTFPPQTTKLIYQIIKEGNGLKLREYRERAGLRQVDVAKKMNVDQAAVSKWESGENGISRKYHKKLAKLYGVTVDELLSDQNEG